MGRMNEPFWWSLFSAGGVVAAFVIPALIFLTGLAIPLGWAPAEKAMSHESIEVLLSHWLIKLLLFVAVSLPLFHCAHRIRHTAVDVGLSVLKAPLAIVCYSGAAAGTFFCAYVLWRI